MEQGKRVFLREATGLIRGISPLGAFVAGLLAVSLPVTTWDFYNLMPAIFPRSNVIVITLLAAIPVIFWAIVYLLYNASMPRAGGDYVWVSRTLHPAIGFMSNFYIFFFQITVLGAVSSLTTLFLVGFFQMSGMALQSSALFALSAVVSTPINTTIAGSVILIIFALIMVSGVANVQRVQIALWSISFLSVLTFIGVLAATPHSVFTSNFNAALGGNATARVIQAAENSGFSPGWTVSASLTALPFGILAVSGFTWAVYAGSELKNPSKSSWASSVVPAVFALVFFLIMGVAVYGTMNYDFVSATGYLFYVNATAVSPGTGLAQAPIALPWVYTIFMNANPYVVAFIGLGYALGMAAALLPIFLLVTRTLFAYSFDRVIPGRFAMVSDRFHTPTFSIAISTIVGIFIIAVSTLTLFFTNYITNVTLGFIVSTFIVAVSAIKFPYGKTKQIFESAPSIVKVRIAGVPLVSVAGVITAVTFAYALYEGFTTPAIGGVISPLSFIIGLLIPFLVPLLIYPLSRAYHRSRGVNIDLAFTEIPPE